MSTVYIDLTGVPPICYSQRRLDTLAMMDVDLNVQTADMQELQINLRRIWEMDEERKMGGYNNVESPEEARQFTLLRTVLERRINLAMVRKVCDNAHIRRQRYS